MTDYKGSPVSMADIMAEKYEQKWEVPKEAIDHAERLKKALDIASGYTTTASVGSWYWGTSVDDEEDTEVDDFELTDDERKDVETTWNYWATDKDKQDLQEYIQAITRAGYDYQDREKEVVNYKKVWYDKRIDNWTGSRFKRCDCGEDQHNFGRHIDGCPAKPKDER